VNTHELAGFGILHETKAIVPVTECDNHLSAGGDVGDPLYLTVVVLVSG
jgi:hypothetical protein